MQLAEILSILELNFDIIKGLTAGLVIGLALMFPLNKPTTSRVNSSIKLDSKKVVDVIDVEDLVRSVSDDGKVAFCRCWKSQTYPYCDGSHVSHNDKCNDNVGPIVIKGK